MKQQRKARVKKFLQEWKDRRKFNKFINKDYRRKLDHFNVYFAPKYTGDIVYFGFCRWAAGPLEYRLTFSLFGIYFNAWFKKVKKEKKAIETVEQWFKDSTQNF